VVLNDVVVVIVCFQLEAPGSVGTKSSYHHLQSELLEKPSSLLEISPPPLESIVGSAATTSEVREFRDADVEEFRHLPRDSKCQTRQQRHRVSYVVQVVTI